MSSAPARTHVVVVGAGIGGLAAALDLSARGHRVSVFERASQVGGKMRSVDVAGRPVEVGPTVLTMRWVLEELFAAAGARLEDHVRLEPLEVLARHAWSDGVRLDLFADEDRSARSVADAFGAAEAQGFRAFARHARRIYDTVEAPFLRAPRPTLATALRRLGPLGLSALSGVDAHRSMARGIAEHLRTRHMRQLFGRYATYCGGSPFEAPATLNLVSHVEARGVHKVDGGMRALAGAIAALVRARGGEIVTDAPVREVLVEKGRAAGVRLAGGAAVAADAVVFNADVAALASGAFGDEASHAVARSAGSPRSLSAVTWAMVARASGFPLVHHNVFFADDSRAEFDTLLRDGRVSEAPTVYACAMDRTGETSSHAEERFLLIVNAPATGDEPERWTLAERQRCDEAMRSTMARCGLMLLPSGSVRSTPVELAAAFPGTGGALYGPRPTGPWSPFTREGSTTRLPGLILAGGSVHPGPGVPMAVLSGRLAARRVREDLASIVPSRPAATSGITSTP